MSVQTALVDLKKTELKGYIAYAYLCDLSLQSWLRVSQNLHTLSQVVVGATFGTIFSILWLLLWNAFVHKAFISSLWVRIVIALGAAGFCLGFVVYVIRHWLRDER